MSGFRKATPKQASLKMGFYGMPGSGKTFTSLLVAEGLANHTGKEIAFIDTENGTDFYCQSVSARKVHPQAFRFDALYTRSIVEITREVKALDPKRYGILIIDSITHVWEACINAYRGKRTRIDTIPIQGWHSIKRPYKELMAYLLSSTMHIILCGRQGGEYTKDPETDELKQTGVKMKAEGETPYEPHILIRFEAIKGRPSEPAVITAFPEKDRTGILTGSVIEWPTYANLAVPLLGVLSGEQAKTPTEVETAIYDSEEMEKDEEAKRVKSSAIVKEFTKRLFMASNPKEVAAIGKDITPEIKKEMTAEDLETLRASFLATKEEASKESPING